MTEIEKLKKKSVTTKKKNGGKRPNSGRKKGKLSEKTLEKHRVEKQVRNRIMKKADRILDAQFSLAQGQTYLYKIEKEKIGSGEKEYYRAKKPELVTSQWEIESFLDGEVENNNIYDEGDTFYYLTTKTPDMRAIDSLWDRAFGKAKQSVDISAEIKQDITFDVSQEKREEIKNKYEEELKKSIVNKAIKDPQISQ